MNFFKFYKYFLYLLKPETSHHLAIFLLKYNLIPAQKNFTHKNLESEICDIHFKNPVGLAAGFDKNAEAIKNLAKHNFGFLEFGTVTPKAQSGNPKPRLFRITKYKSIINRMGFNNVGMKKFKNNFIKNSKNINIPLGVNIGKNKNTESETSDYLELIEYFQNLGDYITINISSPNTPGLRQIQNKDSLDKFIKAITEKNNELAQKKLFLKIAPDISDQELKDICNIALKYKIDALIISNTTISRPDYLSEKQQNINGGLSGKPAFELSNDKIAKAYKILNGKIPIIGVGGIFSAKDAYHKIKLGANLVQIYSALIFEGLALTKQINIELSKLIRKDGFNNISEAIGKHHEQ